jgi:hypothetical protein
VLTASGVAQAQGFSVNSTHHEWLTTEMHFGQQISSDLRGAHFVGHVLAVIRLRHRQPAAEYDHRPRRSADQVHH